MTNFLFVRHGDTIANKSIIGKSPDVPLSEEGQKQAKWLAHNISVYQLDLIAVSPLHRTRQTAEIISEAVNTKVEYHEAFVEIDFGDWSGLSLDELVHDENWHLWNEFRSGTRIPGGELIIEVQSRGVVQLDRLCRRFPDGTVAVVSHADPIRSMIAYYLGLPIDNMLRLRIDVASLSRLLVTETGAELIELNRTQ